MKIFRPAGVTFSRKPGTIVSRSTYSFAPGDAESTAVFVSLILVIPTLRPAPKPRGQLGAARNPVASQFRLWMVDALDRKSIYLSRVAYNFALPDRNRKGVGSRLKICFP